MALESVLQPRQDCRMALTMLTKLRTQAGLTLESVAADIDLSTSQIQRFEKGDREPRLSELQKIAGRFGVTVAELIGERAPKAVPLVSWVSAGRLRASHPVYETDILRYVYLTDLPPGDWLALEVDGDSMNRVAPPGSTIVVNRQDQNLIDGKYYVFGNAQGEATFKRYRVDPDRLQPFSTNPDHETHYIDSEMLTVGRVRRVITDLP
ncbi:LexA family transcriptional regulator [Methylobacterium aquaticum]|nr:LexA family transcriptional regulator [Methylobacterium aquaticum]